MVTHFIPLSGAGKPPTSGPAIRTRRVRPSEKTALRVMPGFSPLGHLPLNRPPRGGAGSARPQRGPRLDRHMSPVGHWPLASSWGANGIHRHTYGHTMRAHRVRPSTNEMPRHGHGLAMRTHRVRPSEKIALRVIPGFSPLGHLALDRPPRGGAGSARPLTGLCLDRRIAPLGPRAFVCPR